MAAGLSSLSPSVETRELRDQNSFPVTLLTKLGRNGTRSYRLADKAARPIDLTGMDVKVVVKTSPDAADDELDAAMPLTATITSAGQGEFEVDYSAVNFTDPQSRVLFVVYDDSGANPRVLSQSKTLIEKAGV